jgi:hypothetical protein
MHQDRCVTVGDRSYPLTNAQQGIRLPRGMPMTQP